MNSQESAVIADDGNSVEYDAVKAIHKTQPKFQCMVTGDKRMSPCPGCSSPNACTTKAMQYKENDQMDEKAVVKISAEGDVVACAKGLEAGDCGYEKGAKVCGKCGAMAVQQKYGMGPGEDEEMSEEEEYDENLLTEEEKGMYRMLMDRRRRKGASGEMIEDDEMLDEYEKGMYEMLRGRMRKKQNMMMPDGMMPAAMADKPDEEEMQDDSEEKNVCPKCSFKNAPGAKFCSQCGTKMMDEDMPEKGGMGYGMGEGDMSEMQRMAEEEMKRRRAARAARMQTMGVKSADWDEDAYVCGFQQKMLAGSATPCAACPGGCAPEQGLPTLIEVQGIAEGMFAGKTLSSGYSDVKDVFIVQVKRDDTIIEAVFDGQDARCRGWHELDSSVVDVKSADQIGNIVSFEDAGLIAVKSIEGDIVSVDADEFEGHEAYAVEINGVDGRSYDVYVSLDGQVLGYDEYDAVQAMEIDSEIAEIALKRAYGIDEREEMSKRGEAMKDGSFPIKDSEDLRNAIMAHGRAKDIDAAKAHIKKRAAAMGMESMIPDEWKSNEKSDPAGDFIQSLVEFEMLAAEVENPSTTK